MVQVKMSHDDGFDILDIVAGGFDRVRKLHLFGVYCPWEYVGEWWTPFLRYVV